MAFEIVDGMTGTKHISSDDLSALNIATVGKADCVLKYGDDFKLTMVDANRATLGTGVGMVGGKRFWNRAATSLTIQSGTQGQKRNDLVVARYAKTGAGIESITPVVIKGTPTTGNAADPATTSNDLKLWRIPLDNVSVGTPVRLFDPVTSLATLHDSLSRTTSDGWTIQKIGTLAICSIARVFNISTKHTQGFGRTLDFGESSVKLVPPVVFTGNPTTMASMNGRDGFISTTQYNASTHEIYIGLALMNFSATTIGINVIMIGEVSTETFAV